MSNPIPNLLALTSIADGSPQQAAPIRNNYAAIQAAVNALATALKGGTAGALFYATDASDVAYLPDAPNDGDALVWNAAASRWKPAASASGVGTQLDYKQITAATASISATTEGTAVAVITGNSVTYDGTKVALEFWCPELIQGGAGNQVIFVLLRDSTVLGHAVADLGNAATVVGERPTSVRAFDTPTAVAHTYSIAAYVTTGAFQVAAGAGGSGNLLPAFLRVTKA